MKKFLLSRRQRYRVLSIVAASIVGGVVGLLYARTFDQSLAGGFVTGFAMGWSLLTFEWFILDGALGERLRKLSVPVYIGVSVISWSVIALFVLRMGQILFARPEDGVELLSMRTLRSFSLAMTVFVGINLFMRTNRLVGSRVLGNFFLGRYNTPVKEDRIFLFLDLEGSVTISEQLGPFRTHSLISKFFHDIAEPINAFHGETHRYVGDQIVITWTINRGIKDARWLHCVFAIKDTIASLRTEYLTEFGLCPEFRIGLHCGDVVAGEVGKDKREIIYIGDVVNTAARLEQLCREKQTWLLVSGELISRTILPKEFESVPLGPVKLRGQTRTLDVHTMRPVNSENGR